MPAAQISVLTWRLSSRPAQQLDPAALPADTGRFVPPRGQRQRRRRPNVSRACIHTVVAFAQRLPASSPTEPPASRPPRVFFSPLRGKTAFRADGEGAAGRRGRHSQPGCVESFFKTRSLNRVTKNFKNTSPPPKKRRS